MNNLIRKKINFKKIMLFYLLILIGIIIILGLLTQIANTFFINNYLIFQTPLKIQNPVLIKKRFPPLLTPAASSSALSQPKNPQEIVFSYRNGIILWKIYGLESSFGKNDDCKKYGKINGFGYAQSAFNWKCYNNLYEVSATVNQWIDNALTRYTLAQALCLYNTGRPVDDCEYYHNFKNL